LDLAQKKEGKGITGRKRNGNGKKVKRKKKKRCDTHPHTPFHLVWEGLQSPIRGKLPLFRRGSPRHEGRPYRKININGSEATQSNTGRRAHKDKLAKPKKDGTTRKTSATTAWGKTGDAGRTQLRR